MAELTQSEVAERDAVRGTVAAGGRQLEYEWIGPAPEAAPTLVFLHDGQGCVDTWRDFPAALAAATGCGALVYSRAGYGGSEALPGPWPVSFMHDEARGALPQVIAALGVRDGFLVGHSDGASISLIYAAGADDGGGAWLRGLALEAPHVFVEPVCLESIAKLPGLYRQSELWRRMVRYHGANAAGCCESWVDVWLRPEFRSWSIEALLPRVRTPVLAIQGERDPYGTLAHLEAVAAGCGGPVETLLLPACGHTPHRQQRDATLQAMTTFLRHLL
ncbi:MAG TPA: alpha/beta hydrolase [Thermoanaerobaculia bacterium]|nr:alpha/beta hydrolase [Thermoanaerobaculia bacterium]